MGGILMTEIIEAAGYDLDQIKEQTGQAIRELLQAAALSQGKIVVVGCSTSEVLGKRMGTATSLAVGQTILEALLPPISSAGLFLAVQCCEHLNRALVVEEECAGRHDLELVSVYPYAGGGGGLAAAAMERYRQPVVAERIGACAGMDIGDVFIGMHLRGVGVVVHSSVRSIGSAHLSMIKTRPKLIGGARARYSREEVLNEPPE
jgi:uncharacterized protein (TIGR01440 family)